MTTSITPRVRFAPSPTGYLHVGGLRTALYNYLFAKKNNGTFILRIEDTDRNRFVEGAVENLMDTLKWCGLQYDEGPDCEGKYGPYMQSQRLELYKKYADELTTNGKAYYCFCDADRLNALREAQKSTNEQSKYDKHCLSLSPEEVLANINAGKPYVIRLNVTPGEDITFNDIVRGTVTFSSDTVDDQVLIKSDGFPTYHMANVVDDHLMEITHVIRGEEWLSSTPKHILLYKFFNWAPPQFAHVPLLLNPDGSKLSKRQGDVAVEDYRDKGYLKAALLNFVALLGWNAGDTKEIYTLNELVDSFTLERVHSSGAVFNVEKLQWLNEQHLKLMPPELYLPKLQQLIAEHYPSAQVTDEKCIRIFDSLKERVTFLQEIPVKGHYYFVRPTAYDMTGFEKNWDGETASRIQLFIKQLEEKAPENKEGFEAVLKECAAVLTVKAAKLIHPVRLCVSGEIHGPGLYDILVILGYEEVIARLEAGLEKLAVSQA